MAETNDLLNDNYKNIRVELSNIEGPSNYRGYLNSKGALVLVEEKDKAEFERGRAEDNRAYKCGCLEIINENIELKDQNKELMRENVGLKENILELAGTINDVLSKKDETEEPEWYDAEKCLPMPDSKVIIEVDHCPISDKYIKKWRYADE